MKCGEKNFHGIELLRFLCAVVIVLWHYQHFFLVDGAFIPAFAREVQPLHGVFWIAYNWGNYAVDVFWAVSGFIFFWKYAGSIHERRTTGGAFFVLRFSRLYPLHFVTLLAMVVLQVAYSDSHGGPFVYGYNDLRHFVLNLFMASDWGFHKGLSFNGPVWSVSVEVLAYAAFFLAARRWRLTGGQLGGIILALVIAKMALPWVKDIPLCLLFFFVGGAVERLAIRMGARPGRDAMLAALVAVLFIAVNWSTAGKVHTFALIALAIALIFFFLVVGDVVANRLVRKLFVALGNTTYSSYLLHFPLQLATVLMTDHLGLSREIFLHPITFVVFIVALFALAEASFVFFERPAQQWLRGRLGCSPSSQVPILASETETVR